MGLVKLVYQGGVTVKNALVQPIFWGKQWSTSALNTAANQVIDDSRQLFAGPYMLGLAQYGGIGPASMLAPIFDSSSEPVGPVTLDALAAFVKERITSGKVPDFRSNDRIIYLIFTNGLSFKNPANASGFHYWGSLDDRTFHFAWVMAPQTDIVSHEIIEACTDPEANGFLQPENGIEVGDICELNPDAEGRSDGINAVSYWSNLDGRCILPVRTAEISISLDDCHIGPHQHGISTLKVSIGVSPSWIDTSGLQPLADPHYHWAFDGKLVKPLGPTNEPILQVQWLPSTDKYSTQISVTVTENPGILIIGSANVSPHTDAETQVLRISCQIRRYVESINRIPPFFIHKLGPDPAVVPSERDIDRLKSTAALIAKETERLSVLTKRPRQNTSSTG